MLCRDFQGWACGSKAIIGPFTSAKRFEAIGLISMLLACAFGLTLLFLYLLWRKLARIVMDCLAAKATSFSTVKTVQYIAFA